MHRLLLAAGLLALLSGCAGMNRAVAVLPDTLDGLGGRAAPARDGAPASAAPPAAAPAPAQPGDAALAVRP